MSFHPKLSSIWAVLGIFFVGVLMIACSVTGTAGPQEAVVSTPVPPSVPGENLPGPANTPSPQEAVITPVPPVVPGAEVDGPHNIPAWQDWLNNGQYANVIDETSKIIESGEASPGYAEARLYRGLAIIAQGGDAQNAKADLEIAQNLVEQLNTVDSKQEQVMLYQGLMVASAQLNDTISAQTYGAKAIELAPERTDSINQQLNNQRLMINNLTQ